MKLITRHSSPLFFAFIARHSLFLSLVFSPSFLITPHSRRLFFGLCISSSEYSKSVISEVFVTFSLLIRPGALFPLCVLSVQSPLCLFVCLLPFLSPSVFSLCLLSRPPFHLWIDCMNCNNGSVVYGWWKYLYT